MSVRYHDNEILNSFGKLGDHLISNLKLIFEFLKFLKDCLWALVTPPFRLKDTLLQIESMANQSVFIIVICVSFAAMVTILESSFHMKIVVHNDSLVPGFAALLILRELGSVTTALLLTSKVGAGIAAEIATMQVTEQVDAFKLLGLNPIRFLVIPRFVACILSCLCLSIIANIVCLFCAMLVCIWQLGFTTGTFYTAVSNFVHFKDIIFASIKGASFGAVIPIMSCFFGFRCRAGAEAVGLTTTKSVVASSIGIIILDFILTFFMFNW